MTAGRQRCAAIKHADVVQTEKTSLENVSAFGVLAVHPPTEIQHQLVQHALQERAIPFPVASLVDFVDAPGCTGMPRRIAITTRTLVSRNLSVGVHVPLAQH